MVLADRKIADIMKSFTKYLTFNIRARMDFVNITGQVEDCVRESAVKEGLCQLGRNCCIDPSGYG